MPVCRYCGGQYNDYESHSCTDTNIFKWPYDTNQFATLNTWTVTTWFKCPSCGGGFNQWDNGKCPFCGMEKGKYGGSKMDVIEVTEKVLKAIEPVMANEGISEIARERIREAAAKALLHTK